MNESKKKLENRHEDKDMGVHGGFGHGVAEEGEENGVLSGLQQGEGGRGGELGSERGVMVSDGLASGLQ